MVAGTGSAAPATPQGPTGKLRVGKNDVRGQARELRDKGIVAVNLGRYEDAVNLLEQAYELSREPSILFDLVQAYRLNGNPERALILCASFLRTGPSISPRNREQIERTVAELGIIVEEIQLQGKRGKPVLSAPVKGAAKTAALEKGKEAAAEPTAATQTEPPPAEEQPAAQEKKEDRAIVATPPLPTSAGSTAATTDRSSDLLRVDARAIDSRPSRPFYRNPWVLTAAGVVVAGIVAVIVYEATRDPGPPRTSWGSQRVF